MAEGQEIVDAHMHLWTPATHPWVERVSDGGHPAGKFGGLQCDLCSAQGRLQACEALKSMFGHR